MTKTATEHYIGSVIEAKAQAYNRGVSDTIDLMLTLFERHAKKLQAEGTPDAAAEVVKTADRFVNRILDEVHGKNPFARSVIDERIARSSILNQGPSSD